MEKTWTSKLKNWDTSNRFILHKGGTVVDLIELHPNLCISFFRYSHVSTKIIARKPSYFCGREGISEDKIPWKQLKH